MKKTPRILLLAALLLTACDPAHTSEFAIDRLYNLSRLRP